MNLKRLFFFLFLLAFPPLIIADEVVLHEGKVIKGTIMSDDRNEVAIRLANNMFLRVDRSKIKEIHREDKKPARRTVTMEMLNVSSAPVAPSLVKSSAAKPASTVPPASAAPVVSASDPKNIKPETTTTRKEKGNGPGVETYRVETYVVNGKTFEEVEDSILTRVGGKGPLQDGKRMPSSTTLNFEWDGKPRIDAGRTKWSSIVILSTITVLYPEWKAPATVEQTSVAAWDAFIADLRQHDAGHVEIYRSGLRSLNDTLMNIDAPNEEALRTKSKTVVTEWRSRIEKRQEGHDRHAREKKKIETK